MADAQHHSSTAVNGGSFGPALTFAAKSMAHTANQLRQWATEPDLGVKSFTKLTLSTSRSICLPCQGVLLDRMRDLFSVPSPVLGITATENVAATVFQKSMCLEKFEGALSLLSSWKGATIANISRNPAFAATKIHTIRDESRCLHCQLACAVLFDAIEKDGAILPGGAKGNQIRKVVEIMDGTISKVLTLGGATVELELWRVHAEHIRKVSNDGLG